MKTALAAAVLMVSAAGAVTALPILGYSSSTGLLLGGLVVLENGLSLDAYYATEGVIKFQPAYTGMTHGGLVNAQLEFRKIIEKDWFGWGNDTDGDSSTTMDMEIYHLTGSYTYPLSDRLLLSGGLDARNSTIYNTEPSQLWNEIPFRDFDPVFTVGPSLTLTWVAPAPVNGDYLLETGGFLQIGDVKYGGSTSRARLTLRPWHGGETAAGVRYHRHFGVDETPVPFTSSLGSQNDFRGYSDYRFTGEAWIIGQFEVRQRLLTLTDQEGEPALGFGAAAFAEAGRTAVDAGDLSLNDLHTDVGGGIRITARESACMRIDAAWGDEGMVISSGFDSAF